MDTRWLNLNATDTASLTQLIERSVNQIVLKECYRVSEFCGQESPFVGEIEVDEWFFSAKRGRGAVHNTIMSGILKWNRKALTKATVQSNGF